MHRHLWARRAGVAVAALLASLLAGGTTEPAQAQTVHLYDGGSTHVFREGEVCALVYGESPFAGQAVFMGFPSGEVTLALLAREVGGGVPVHLRFHDVRGRGTFEIEGISRDAPTAGFYSVNLTGRLFELLSDTLETSGVLTVTVLGRNSDRPIEVVHFGAVIPSAMGGRAYFDQCRRR
jgi:hypothetical protein